MYLSAGFDEKLASRHPEWFARRKDEKLCGSESFAEPGYHRLCFNSSYLDYLLEQIKEVCRNYDADGIFLDIVGTVPCYCQNCINILKREGKDPYDEKNICDLAERTSINYRKRVREAIDSVTPGMPVFHNSGHIDRGRHELASMNSHYELESLPTGGWGYDHFPFSARYVQGLGGDYLGMTGKFYLSWGEFGGFKHPNALRYEVALSAANGAKCSVGDQLHPYGDMDMATYELVGKAYGELEEKELWLDGVSSVADIGILSYESVYSKSFGFDRKKSDTHDFGAGRIMLEGGYLFDVLDLESNFEKYKVIVLPDGIRPDKSLCKKLKNYTARGGKVLASGKSGLDEAEDSFVLDFGVEYVGENEYKPSYLRPEFEVKDLGIASFVCYGRGETVKLTDGCELAKNEDPFFNRTVEHFCSHRHAPNRRTYSGVGMSEGRDGIYIAWSIFEEYYEYGSLFARNVVMYALDRLLGSRKYMETNLAARGVNTLMKQEKENRYVAHLLYGAPVRRGRGVDIIEDLPPIYGTELTLRVNEKIKNVYLAPQMKKLTFVEDSNGVHVTVDRFECHQMVVFDY